MRKQAGNGHGAGKRPSTPEQGGQTRSEIEEWYVEGSAGRPTSATPRWTIRPKTGGGKRANGSRAKKPARDPSPRKSQAKPKRDRVSGNSPKTAGSKKNGRPSRARVDASVRQWLSSPQGVGAAESTSNSTARRTRRSATRATSRRSQRGSRKSGRLDLNAATFEQLRALDLSVTQSARLIAQRESRGGFQSLDELDSLYGFPRATITMLKNHTVV